MKILVVDDDLVCRDMLTTMLRRFSYDVIAAMNGREALEKIGRNDCRVVISDWVMPEVNGPTLCRAIRAADFGHYIFIILLTSRGAPEDVIEGLSAGADEFMTKPFHPGEVRARLRTAERILGIELTDAAHQASGAIPTPPPEARFPYRVRQWAAPCFDGSDPEAADFIAVECRELANRGIVFDSAAPWETKRLIVTLGGEESIMFMLCRVTDQQQLIEQGSVVFRLECEFLRRIATDTRRLAKALRPNMVSANTPCLAAP